MTQSSTADDVLLGGGSPRTRKPVRPLRHYRRGVLAVVVAVIGVLVLMGLARNPNIQWAVVGQFLFSPAVLGGLWTTVQMSLLAMALSVVLAVVVALMRVSSSRVMQSIAALYIFLLRGVPMIVQVIFWGNIGLFVKTITIGIPFTSVEFFSVSTSSLVTPFIASVMGLGLAESAYMAEIIRGGLLSVARGQRQAAKALGMTGSQTFRRIVIPQAWRVIVPPTGNQLISLLKATSIVSVIAGGDLLTQVMNISGLNYRTIELLLVATIWYLAVVIVLSVGQFFIERKVAEK
ncbi:amino acid ABC transporter permease [Amycolatopsis jejuensis]|uniref:amino acid ABC transporter permease n=1 Tax=Amycolatopsis jejuensis TaxID=330084 RepID=UPI000689AB22|nr:amino acid ABC transporter permease [Amycolatopsis jejuensis]